MVNKVDNPVSLHGYNLCHGLRERERALTQKTKFFFFKKKFIKYPISKIISNLIRLCRRLPHHKTLVDNYDFIFKNSQSRNHQLCFNFNFIYK